MFVRYRGGGIGHQYIWEIEKTHENMSLERDHWHRGPKPQAQENSMDVDANISGEEELGDRIHPGSLEGSIATDEDESDGGEYVPLEAGDSSDDSEDDKGAGVDGDSEGLGSDASYDSYGLADP